MAQRQTVAERHNNPLNIKAGPATKKWIDEGVAELGESATESSTPSAKPSAKPAQWSEVASHLDPMLPQKDYDEVRQKYFMDVILPRVPAGQDRNALYKEFKKRTDRAPLLSAKERVDLRVSAAAASTMKAFAAPLSVIPSMKKLHDDADEMLQADLGVAEREGISLGLETMGGALVGELPAVVASFALAGPVAGALVGKAKLGATAALRAKNLLAGGLSFGAIDAAKEQNGSRLMAGVEGFGEGLLWTLPVIPFLKAQGLAKTTEEAQELLTRAIQEPASVPQEVHTKIAEQVLKESKILKTQEVLPASIVRAPNIRGVLISMLPKEGNGAINIELKVGKEFQALEQIRNAQLLGAEFNSIRFHPNEEARAFKFLREARDSEVWKYEDAMLVEVKEGLAEQAALEARKVGVPAEAVGSKHVELKVKREEREVLPGEEAGTAVSKDEKTLLSELEESVAQNRAPALPEGVSLIGKQGTGEPGKFLYMYDLELSPGKKTTFVLYPGQNISEKVEQVRKKWASFGDPTKIVPPKLSQDNVQKDAQGYFTKLKSGEKRYLTDQEIAQAKLMSPERATEIVTQAGFDASKVDLDAIRELGEAEFNRLLEVRQRVKEVGSGFDPLQDWMEKVAQPKGTGKSAAVGIASMLPYYKQRKLTDVPTGDTLVDSLRKIGAGVLTTPQMKISMHPFRTAIEVSEEVYQKLNPGTRAALYQNWRSALKDLGVKMPGNSSQLYPAMMFTKNTLPEERFHEFLHAANVKAGLTGKFDLAIPQEMRHHAVSIATHLSTMETYTEYPFTQLLDEAFTYAATAIRYAKTPYGQEWLETITKWNGTEAQLKDFVRGTAEGILKYSQGRIDSASERILQRKMTDLIRRSDPNISYGISTAGQSARWDPQKLGWAVDFGDEGFVKLESIDDVWDFMLENDVSDIGPSLTFGLETLGMRGPMAAVSPTGHVTLPTVGLQPEERWMGWSAVSGYFRPFLPWVASLDKKINGSLAKRGEKFPLFEVLKKVDDQTRMADQWLTKTAESGASILKGTPSKRLFDYFQVLTYAPADKGAAAAKYRLSADDLVKVGKLEEWVQQLQDETGVPVWEYMREMFPRLQYKQFAPEAVWKAAYDPKSAGFWEKAVREGDFRPNDPHMGRFMSYLMGAGYEKKYTGDALKQLERVINLKVPGKDGEPREFLSAAVKWPLQNYVKTVRGIPDQTQIVINRAMKDWIGSFQGKLQDINKHLPKGMKIPGSEANISPKLLQRLMTFSYASALGLRPAVAVRDSLQVLSTSLPVLGGRKFSRGLELMFSKSSRKIADDAGIFISKTNVGELYGEIMGEVPIEGKVAQWTHDMANIMLAPSRWGDNFARGVTFLGEYDASLKAIKMLRAGKMNQAQFMKTTSLWFMDDQISSQLLVRAQKMGEPLEEVAKQIAQETVDLTQWPYRRGTNPSILRTGMGRIFGQFGRWPANYADFLARIYQKSKGGEHRTQALGALGLWGATNWAASTGMEALGADVSKWYFLSPAGYSLSPHSDFVLDLAQAPEESDQGREARARVLKYPLNFVPGRIAAENILQSMEELGPKVGLMSPELLEVLGFKALKRMPDIPADELLQYEMGFGRQR